jgi:hypothetical protein
MASPAELSVGGSTLNYRDVPGSGTTMMFMF